MKIVPVPLTITVSSLIAGTYAPPAVHEPITTAIWGIPAADMRAWLKKMRPKWSRSGKTSSWSGRNAPPGVDEVEARQPVLRRDLLRAQVLLDREREVRAALDRGVVGDDDALAALDDADAGDDPGPGRLAVVHVPGGQRAELEEGGAGVDEPVDPLARGQLPARAVPLDRALTAAARDLRRALAQLGDEALHPLAPGRELVRVTLGPRRQERHRRRA